MMRSLSVALVTVAVAAGASWAQGPVQRAGQALDNAGKNIRRGVESAVARGQISAQERDVLARVTNRILWDKRLVNSTLQVEVQADGTTILRGSVLDAAAKKRAVDLAESTIGVTTVVDELAIVKEVKVIQSQPARVVPVAPPVTVPAETKVIVKP